MAALGVAAGQASPAPACRQIGAGVIVARPANAISCHRGPAGEFLEILHAEIRECIRMAAAGNAGFGYENTAPTWLIAPYDISAARSTPPVNL